METNENKDNEKKPWIEKNAWMIAVLIAIFFLRVCSDMYRH